MRLQIGWQITLHLQPIHWERGRLVPEIYLQTTLHLQSVADGCRWLQIKPSICNHTKQLTIKGLDRILRARWQSCR